MALASGFSQGMAFAPRLDLRQTQSLVMTPQLRQAIQLLQYSNLEASQFIEDELLKNPLLEQADGGESVSAIEAVLPLPAEIALPDATSFAGTGMMTGAENAAIEIDGGTTSDAGSVADGYGAASGGWDTEDGFNIIEAIGSKAPNLREHLEQ